MPRQYMPSVDRVCQECRKTFRAYYSAAKIGQAKFCSRSCKGKASQVSVADFFASRLSEPTTTGCILWAGCKRSNGYGIISRRRSHRQDFYYAHRVSWELSRGPIPAGLHVLHNCPGGDNPLCVNPDHLFLGTHADNMKDMATKGRSGQRGNRSWKAKLDPDKVRSIRRRIANGESTQADICRELGISSSVVSEVVSRKAWGHVTDSQRT